MEVGSSVFIIVLAVVVCTLMRINPGFFAYDTDLLQKHALITDMDLFGESFMLMLILARNFGNLVPGFGAYQKDLQLFGPPVESLYSTQPFFIYVQCPPVI